MTSLTSLHMMKVCAKLFSELFTNNQKNNQETIMRELLEHVQNKPDFIHNVIIGSKIWIF